MMETEIHAQGYNISMGNIKNVNLSCGQYYNGKSSIKFCESL